MCQTRTSRLSDFYLRILHQEYCQKLEIPTLELLQEILWIYGLDLLT